MCKVNYNHLYEKQNNKIIIDLFNLKLENVNTLNNKIILENVNSINEISKIKFTLKNQSFNGLILKNNIINSFGMKIEIPLGNTALYMGSFSSESRYVSKLESIRLLSVLNSFHAFIFTI